MTQPNDSFDAKLTTGLTAELIACSLLGQGSKWFGGNNAGFDLRDPDGLRVQVKSAALKRRMPPGTDHKIDVIGIHTKYPIPPDGADYLVLVATSGVTVGARASVVVRDDEIRLTLDARLPVVRAFRVDPDRYGDFFAEGKKPVEHGKSRNIVIPLTSCTELSY